MTGKRKVPVEAAKGTILVVDDSESTIEVIRRNLVGEGFQTCVASSVDQALAVLRDVNVDLIITDLKMPRASGMELIDHVRRHAHDMEVMLITGYPSIQDAVQAVKNGAAEYLVKPFTHHELMTSVTRVLERLHQRRAARRSPGTANDFGLIGDSPALKGVCDLIGKAAEVDATVLIQGESGTGKELVARAIHYHGRRRTAPFVPVNCSAIPENLLESELFGHVKGAFTDARESRAGFFQVADGGTLFLDEIGDASPSLQAKLLRVLQSGEIFMVGCSRPRRVDVRIVAASHKDLAEMVERGAFRDDLYYRLNVVEISLPPLRLRGDDVLLLVNHFLARAGRSMGRPEVRLSDAALDVLRRYDWPGNIRELENFAQRLTVIGGEDGVIALPDLPRSMKQVPAQSPGNRDVFRTLAQVEADHVNRVMAAVQGNKTQAAVILGIDRKTLREKLTRMQRPRL